MQGKSESVLREVSEILIYKTLLSNLNPGWKGSATVNTLNI